MDAGNGDGAVGGDVMPAIRGRRGDVGRSDSVPDEGAGLEQVGAPASQSIGDREIAAAAGKGKTGDSLRRQPVVGADGDPTDAAGGRVGAPRRFTPPVLPNATRPPHQPSTPPTTAAAPRTY